MTSYNHIRGISSILIAGLLLGGSLIFYRFPQIPQYVSFDEIEFAKLALSLKNQPYTPYSPLATGHATLYFYILLTSIQHYGLSIFALRLPAALFGILSIISLFFFTHEMTKLLPMTRKKSIIMMLSATLLYAGMRWQFNFSRFAFEASLLLFLELTSLWMMVRYIRTRASFPLILSGVAAGLAYNSYTPGRLFFIIPAILLLYEMKKLWSSRAGQRDTKQNDNQNTDTKNELTKQPATLTILLYLACFFIPFILSILPLTMYLSKHPDLRYNQLAFFTDEHLSFSQKMAFSGQNLSSMIQMFFVRGDMNGRHNYPGKPALNPIMAIAFGIGLIALFRKSHPAERVMGVYFLLSLLPAFLTYPWENPNMLRTVTCLPSVVYIASRGIATITEIKMSKYMILAAVILLLTVSALYEARTYFVYQTQIFPHAFDYPQDQFEMRVKK